jgi:type II secretory pathway pseudopilin PulG
MSAARAQSRESGFALLFVFAMAAAVAFLFYRELPRIAFERQREKEQLLIERGEQYKRAIQLYVRKFNRYPAQLSDLEKTNNIRFLRRRYKDPMTGKDEWRLIHIGPGGVLTDSVLNKPGSTGEQKLESKEQAEAEGQQGPLPVIRRRPSELPGAQPAPGFAVDPTAGGSPDQPPGVAYVGLPPYASPGGPDQPRFEPVPIVQPQTSPSGVVVYPIQPGQQQVYPAPGQGPGQTGQPVYPIPGQVQYGQPAYPVPGQVSLQPGTTPGAVQTGGIQPTPGIPIQVGVPQAPGQAPLPPGSITGPQPPGQQPPYPTQNVPGLPGPYGQPGVPSLGAITITPGTTQPSQPPQPVYSTQPGVSGAPAPGQSTFPQPGYQPLPSEPAQNPALQLIRDLLTKPRPGGLAAIQAQQQQAGALGVQIMGGGIAGVASTAEGESIMVYNERTKYNEWEFVYDFRKDPLRMGRLGQIGIQPGQVTAPATGSQGQSQPSLTPGTRRR